MSISEQLKHLPDSPGIYLFYSITGELIYVGKATSLNSRVRSYWRTAKTDRPIERMIHEVVKIKTISTDSVLEAIILEGEYIKKFRPKYNIDWRDDKSWNYIYISKGEYPQIKFIREHELRSVIPTKGTLSVPKAEIQGSKARPRDLSVLDPRFHGDDNLFGPYPYLRVKEFLKILQRIFAVSICHPHQNRPCLYRQMGQCLGVCTGEISARDYKQKVIKPLKLFLQGKKSFLLKQLQKRMEQASKASNYEEAGRLRDQIRSLQHIQDVALLNGSFVHNLTPNTSNLTPLRIEGYDISNLGITDKVGSMVVFDNHGPIKSEYRKFNIKTVTGQSDVDCLAEVLERRLKHSDWPLPNLFLIDGGAPQVNKTKEILKKFNIKISVIGIAKGPKRQKNEFVMGEKSGSLWKFIKDYQNLLIQVRDEAHRFAIAFNRSKRKIK